MTAWRDGGRMVKVGPIDARVVPLWGVALYAASWWALGLAVGGTALLWWCQHKGLRLEGLLRKWRKWFAGKFRPAASYKHRRRMC